MSIQDIVPDYYELDRGFLHLSQDRRLEYEVIRDVQNEVKEKSSTRITCNNTNTNLRFSKSLLSFTLRIFKADGTKLKADDNVAFVNNFAANAFKQIRLQINDKEISNKRFVGLVSLVRHLLQDSNDYANSIATREGVYFDTSIGTDIEKYQFHATSKKITKCATYNKGYQKRHQLTALSKEVRVSVRLSDLIEFFSIDKVLRGVIVDLELTKNDTDNVIICPAGTTEKYQFEMKDLVWVIPKVYPSVVVEQYFSSILNKSKIIQYEWEEMSCEKREVISSSDFTTELRISHLAKYVYVLFQAPTRYSATGNNMAFDHAEVRKITVTVDSIVFTPIRCSYESTSPNYEDAYNAFVTATLKEGDTDCGTIVDKKSFVDLYPLYCFDTGNTEMNVFESPSDKSHFIKVESEFKNAPNVVMYILYKYDKCMTAKPVEGRITIVE